MGARRDDVMGKHREAIRAAAARNRAESIALVGSVARGDDGEGSDYDFVAQFEDGASLFDMAGLKLDLDELLGCCGRYSEIPEGPVGTATAPAVVRPWYRLLPCWSCGGSGAPGP